MLNHALIGKQSQHKWAPSKIWAASLQPARQAHHPGLWGPLQSITVCAFVLKNILSWKKGLAEIALWTTLPSQIWTPSLQPAHQADHPEDLLKALHKYSKKQQDWKCGFAALTLPGLNWLQLLRSYSLRAQAAKLFHALLGIDSAHAKTNRNKQSRKQDEIMARWLFVGPHSLDWFHTTVKMRAGVPSYGPLSTLPFKLLCLNA